MKLNEVSGKKIQIRQLTVSRQGIREALQDVAYGRPARTSGPVHVRTAGKRLFLLDGYHRVVEAILSGQSEVLAVEGDSDYSIAGDLIRFDNTALFGLEEVIAADPDICDYLAITYPACAPTVNKIKSDWLAQEDI